MTFESIVRPIIGDAYDAEFPLRSKEYTSDLTSDEQCMAEELAMLYVRADCIVSKDVRSNVRTGLISSLKSVRKSSELRWKRLDERARRNGVPLYRFRVTTPDGTKFTYPKRGTKYADRGHVVLYRHISKPRDQIEATIKDYYAPYLAKSTSEERTKDLHAAIVRDIEMEIVLQNNVPDMWWIWSSGTLASVNLECKDRVNEPTARWHYEYLQLEGTAFDVDEEPA